MGDRFRIQSVTIFGDQLLNSGLAILQKELSDKKKENDDAWMKKRKLIEDELIATEKNYCSELTTLNLMFDELFSKKILDVKFKSQCMSNLPSIASFHCVHFSKSLMAGNIIATFIQYSDFFKIYMKYVNEYD